MDSGNGHDLISREKVNSMGLDAYTGNQINFHTANGIAKSTEMVKVDTSMSDKPIEMRVLEDTPLVLSIGSRCAHEGYSFVWPAGKTPYMLNQEGVMIKMKVKDNIPYVYQNQASMSANDDMEWWDWFGEDKRSYHTSRYWRRDC